MTVISDIDEFGINTNLKVRYKKDCIYVSTAFTLVIVSRKRGLEYFLDVASTLWNLNYRFLCRHTLVQFLLQSIRTTSSIFMKW